MVKNREYELLRPPDIPKLHGVGELLLLPALGMSLNSIKVHIGKKFYTSQDILTLVNYKNCYLWWEGCPEKFNNECYLLFQPSRYSLSYHFPIFLDYLINLNTFLGWWIVDINTIIIALSIDSKWKDAKKYVVRSQYSKLGVSYANFYFNTGELAHQIIVKNEKRREILEEKLDIYIPESWELFDKIDKEKETFKMEIIDYELT